MVDSRKMMKCFVIAPIGDSGTEIRKYSDIVYRHIISPAIEPLGYEVMRADMISSPGIITNQIIEHILNSDLVIADLTGNNPNVMYELALRHSTKKPVIQITSKGENIPFDVANMRTIIVDIRDLSEVERAKESLRSLASAINTDPSSNYSPVFAFESNQTLRGKKSTADDGWSTESSIANALKDIDQRLESLDYKLNKIHKNEAEEIEYSRDVFVVHGHHGELKNELARFLERLEFNPIILHEQPDRGQTIFSKLTGEMKRVGFAFILLTPDDVGAQVSSREKLNHRARQNVVFEHGLFVSHLEPHRVCAICKGDIEIPSDLSGVIYKKIHSGSGLDSIAFEIIRELKAAGYRVDANKA